MRLLLTVNWHQKDRSYWQRQLEQYMALNSGRHLRITRSNKPGKACSAFYYYWDGYRSLVHFFHL
jgi:hypothetical protein